MRKKPSQEYGNAADLEGHRRNQRAPAGASFGRRLHAPCLEAVKRILPQTTSFFSFTSATGKICRESNTFDGLLLDTSVAATNFERWLVWRRFFRKHPNSNLPPSRARSAHTANATPRLRVFNDANKMTRRVCTGKMKPTSIVLF